MSRLHSEVTEKPAGSAAWRAAGVHCAEVSPLAPHRRPGASRVMPDPQLRQRPAAERTARSRPVLLLPVLHHPPPPPHRITAVSKCRPCRHSARSAGARPAHAVAALRRPSSRQPPTLPPPTGQPETRRRGEARCASPPGGGRLLGRPAAGPDQQQQPSAGGVLETRNPRSRGHPSARISTMRKMRSWADQAPQRPRPALPPPGRGAGGRAGGHQGERLLVGEVQQADEAEGDRHLPPPPRRRAPRPSTRSKGGRRRPPRPCRPRLDPRAHSLPRPPRPFSTLKSHLLRLRRGGRVVWGGVGGCVCVRGWGGALRAGPRAAPRGTAPRGAAMNTAREPAR